MQRTRLDLTRQARRLTVENGLHGFTIEELCEIVGISRRTFFNYFPCKEDAILGHRDDGLSGEVLARFVNARPAECIGLSPTLFDDLVALAVDSLGQLDDGLGPGTTTPEAVIAREPQFLAKFIRESNEMERLLASVISEREGLPHGDAVAEIAVALLGTLVRRAAALYFTPGNTIPFVQHVHDSADAVKTLFAATLPPRAEPHRSSKEPHDNRSH